MLIQLPLNRTKIAIAVRNSILLASAFSLAPAAFADTPAPVTSTPALSAFLNHDDLTYAGITLYGTVDIGLVHQTHGAPLSDSQQSGVQYVVSKNSNKSITTLAPNGLSASKIGIKGDIKIADDLSAVFKFETGFNPTSGMISDGPKSLVANNGVPLNEQTSNSDSSRAGQIFQGAAYGGVSSKKWGTLTAGRQNNLQTDALGKYDPQGGSYAFSLIGYSGVMVGGGSTQDARLDSSLRYGNQWGSTRVATLYQFGNGSGDNNAYQFNIGTDFSLADLGLGNYGKVSLDAFYTQKQGAVSFASLSATQVLTAPTGSLAATISDNTAYTLMAKYTLNPVNLYAGYEHIRYENPSSPLRAGTTGLGGYLLSVVNNNAYTINKTLDISWLGAKVAITPKLDLTGAYYHYSQNSFKGNGCQDDSAASCGGSLNATSLSANYKVSKRLDFYGGAMYSKVKNGLASGYLNTSSVDPMVGMRYNF